jgi:hypothetical protein
MHDLIRVAAFETVMLLPNIGICGQGSFWS